MTLASMIRIPDRVRDGVLREFGAQGQAWLDEHPGRLEKLAKRWQIEPGEHFHQGLPINIVFACSRHNEPLALKTGYPHPELLTEISTLELWKDQPWRVQVSGVDRDCYAILMQQIVPGTTFRADMARGTGEVIGENVTRLFSEVPLQLEGDHEFPSYSDWCNRAFGRFRKDGSDGEFEVHIARAEKQLVNVLGSGDDNWLLHGDLHHENMLRDGAGDYIAIDPKGVTGTRLMEYGRFIHNFFDDRAADRSLAEEMDSRLSVLEGEFSQSQLMRTGYLDLVLGCCWTLNSGGDITPVARQLLEFMAKEID